MQKNHIDLCSFKKDAEQKWDRMYKLKPSILFN